LCRDYHLAHFPNDDWLGYFQNVSLSKANASDMIANVAAFGADVDAVMSYVCAGHSYGVGEHFKHVENYFYP
jgi:hypothetical protein